MRDKHWVQGLTMLTLVAIATSATRAGSKRSMREIPVEILRYDTGSAASAPSADPATPGPAGIVGPPEVGAYLVRFRIEPGERIVVARGLIRDGFAPRTRSPGAGRKAARLFGSLGYHLVLREVPGDLHQTIGPLAALVLPGRPGSKDKKPPPGRVLVLRDDSLHYHDGYATALVMIEANELTRIDFQKIVIRRDGRGRSRARSSTVLVRNGPEIDRQKMLQLMAGRAPGPSREPRNAASAVDIEAVRPAPLVTARPALATRSRDRDGFGPP